MGIVGGGPHWLLTFLELPACDVTLGHGGRQGGHGEVLRSTVGRGDTKSCIGYALDRHREKDLSLRSSEGLVELTTATMSADDGSSEPARAGKGNHCHYKIRRLLGDNNNDDDRLYAAALLSTITKTAWMGRWGPRN